MGYWVNNICCVHFLNTICTLWPRTQAEVFTAIADCEPLIDVHQRIIDGLDNYIEKEEVRLSVLKKRLDIYKREQEMATEDIPNYLGNPINAFTLIKRLTSDLDEIEKSISIRTEYARNMTVSDGDDGDVKYPSKEDLVGAAVAMARLQETYKLNVTDLANGILNGVAYSFPMSAGDCFELGRALYNDNDYKNAIPWLMEALRKYREENNYIYSFLELDILDYISYAYYLHGDPQSALEWTIKLLKLDPTHVTSYNIPIFEIQIAVKEISKDKDTKSIIETRQKPMTPLYDYATLCRGEIEIPPGISKRLSCYYLTENHPFLRLAPIKAEKLHMDPDAFLFHDVINDDEIELIKNIAKPRFKRADVYDPVTGGQKPANYRISKSAWLEDKESNAIAKLTQRVADFTGLSMEFSENLQIANYGIGGHYVPHYDFATKSEDSFRRQFHGNRIATVLFYMTDVAQGGATVFTELGLSVFPVKHAALFWMNLHPSCEGDLATHHAGCPVLRGSKWVANKWIHQHGQEFKRPCTLEFQAEEVIRRHPRSLVPVDGHPRLPPSSPLQSANNTR